MPTPPAPHRLPRAAVAAAMAAGVGSAAHALGGGTPSIAGVAVALAVLLGPAWLLAGRERKFGTVAGVQLAGQQLVHAWLELDPAGAHLPPPDDVSLYGHVLAGLAVAVWLRSGERRVWNAARSAAAAVARWWRWAQARRASPPAPPAPPVAVPDVRHRRVVAVLAHVVVRRGPPVAA